MTTFYFFYTFTDSLFSVYHESFIIFISTKDIQSET